MTHKIDSVMVYRYIREKNFMWYIFTWNLSVHVGYLGRDCHQPNQINELHKTVHEIKLGLRSHSRQLRYPPECPAMTPHEIRNLVDYVQGVYALCT